MSDKPDLFRVEINPDYTISVVDSNNKHLIFRDITGLDLELIEDLIKKSKDSNSNNIYHIVGILNLISTQSVDFARFPQRILCSLFDIVNQHILCNYISKIEWLKICYTIQKGSFVNIHEMEKVPMSKFITMYEIHKELTDSTPPDLE